MKDKIKAMIGENVVLLCMNYIYAGKLTAVDDHYAHLDNAFIVYETGELRSTTWKDAQRLPDDDWLVKLSAVESFGRSGR